MIIFQEIKQFKGMAPKIETQNTQRKNLKKFKGEMNKSVILAGDINAPL